MSLTFLSTATGIHKQRVKQDLDKLIEMNIIVVTEESTFTKSRKIGFNKDYDLWNEVQSSKKETVSNFADTTVSETADTTVSNSAYQERNNIKKNIKKKDDDMQPNYFSVYEKAFGYPPALLISDFEHWIDSEESQFTEPEEIIIEVIHRAKKQIPRNPAKYVSKILKDLHNMELYSLEAVKAYNQKFDEKVAHRGADDGKKVQQDRRSSSRPAKEKFEFFGDKVGRY